MRGRIARRITPAFAAPTEFGNRLIDVLSAQGYAVSGASNSGGTPVLVIPIQAIGSVIVFTVSEETMDQVVRWARELDRPPTGQTANALFTYSVKYADAQDLAKTLGDLLGGGGAGGTAGSAAAAGTGIASSSPSRTAGSNGRVVVNSATNTLIFRGSSADEYQQITSLLRELDRPTKSALVEVVVAELNVSDALSLGINWTKRLSTGEGTAITGSGGSSGLNLSIVTDAGRLLANINALATNQRGRILSNPRVVARNGETATIQVGREVPIVTSTQSLGPISGGVFSSAQQTVSNQVQYRSTGVILKVRPVINSGNRLDLEVSQEVSAAESTLTGVSSSPTISTRRIETKMSLRDGSTIVLGGLISRSTDNNTAGVPWLKDIPLIGSLFRSQEANGVDNEMIVMITPHVINDDFEAEAVTDAVQSSFGQWASDIPRSRTSTRREPAADTPLPGAAAPTTATDGGVIIPAPVAPPATPRPDPAPVAPAPAAAPRPAAAPNDGVIMSRPESPGTPPPRPDGAASAASQPARPAAASPPAPIQGGQEVTDPKIKEEIRQLLQKR
jgi:general secretion pathway protein D